MLFFRTFRHSQCLVHFLLLLHPKALSDLVDTKQSRFAVLISYISTAITKSRY